MFLSISIIIIYLNYILNSKISVIKLFKGFILLNLLFNLSLSDNYLIKLENMELSNENINIL